MGIYNSNCDLNKYKIFYAVADCKSFSKAAEILHISQPAISHAIKELEEQLDAKLFIRTNKAIKLTDVGENLIFYIQKALNNIVKAENYIKDYNNDSLNGVIKIGIYSHLAIITLPNIIKKFNKQFPNVKFYIYSSSSKEMKDMLRHRELDLVIAQYPIFLNDNNYKEIILCEMESCLFGSTIHHKGITIDDVKNGYPIILPFDGYVDIDNLEEKFKRNNLIINNNIRCYKSEVLKPLVNEGLGIGWCLKKCIEKELQNNIFFEIKNDLTISKTKFSMVYDEKFINDSTKKFISFFEKEINN